MKNFRITILTVFSFLFLSAFTLIALEHYEVTQDFSLEFKSKDPSGSFKKMEGQIEFDEKDLSKCSFDLKIDVRSISTGNGMMTKKSQTPEWFDAVKYPYAKFKSTKVLLGWSNIRSVIPSSVKSKQPCFKLFVNNSASIFI
jgi:hypothetical protein